MDYSDLKKSIAESGRQRKEELEKNYIEFEQAVKKYGIKGYKLAELLNDGKIIFKIELDGLVSINRLSLEKYQINISTECSQTIINTLE